MKINPHDWVYDLESYPNIFTASFKHVDTGARQMFEISEWCNDFDSLIHFLYALRQSHCRLIGFNNIGYDYPMLHWLIHHYNPAFSHYNEIFEHSSRIIATPWENRYDNVIRDKDTAIQQIDLAKVHHFDNKARLTKLKILAFNMRSRSIEDLPYPPGTVLTFEESRNILPYNNNDVDETTAFYMHSLAAIKFREELGPRFLNYSDVKIGKEYIIDEMEKASPGSCYARRNGRRGQRRQTIRPYVDIGDVIFPYIKFNRPEFQMIHEWLSKQRVVRTKGVFKDKAEIKKMQQHLADLGVITMPKKLPESITTTLNGFTFHFGLGGIHGSIDSCIVAADEEYILVDWDVASYYPNVAIQNKLYPEHLSEVFCTIYNQTYQKRKQHKKGTVENAALKLALNGGGFGGAGDEYCPIYDLQYMLGITVNGQLLLCMLSEYLLTVPGLQLIQVNTDGVTVKCLRKYEQQMIDICSWWERFTCLELERTNYKRMFIRDVNNYIGEYESGKLKRKGAYGYETPLDNPNTGERQWHKNHSALVVPKAAEAALVRGESIENFIINHSDIFDFMLRTKINRADRLMFNTTTEIQRVSRYYVSNSPSAGTLLKLAPPPKGKLIGQFKRKNKLPDNYYESVIEELKALSHHDVETDVTGLPWDDRINNKKATKYKITETGIEADYKVVICNDISLASRDDIDYAYYIKQAKKLVEVLQ